MEDLEKTVAKHDEQIGKILTILETVVDRQNRLDDALLDLAAAQSRLAEAQRETEDRIQKLVSGIGELLRRQ